jgi:RNA polymerase sigma-70 factor (ECF subfamily)
MNRHAEPFVGVCCANRSSSRFFHCHGSTVSRWLRSKNESTGIRDCSRRLRLHGRWPMRGGTILERCCPASRPRQGRDRLPTRRTRRPLTRRSFERPGGGDRQAHVAIWRKYMALVRSKIGRSVGGQDVDDHVQEVFLRLFEHLPQLRDPGALRSFIIGITLRVGGTELRRRRCRWWLTITPTGELPEPPPSRDDGSDVREVLARLLAVLGRLSPHSSRVFELRYVEEKELTDVAKAMKISLATAKRHLARASACFYAMAEREPALAHLVQRRLSRDRAVADLPAMTA